MVTGSAEVGTSAGAGWVVGAPVFDLEDGGDVDGFVFVVVEEGVWTVGAGVLS